MTLKAAIIYVQGSAGNLLSRTLSLSESTIPYVTKDQCQSQPYRRIDQSTRLALYDNWNPDNWIETEKNISLWYRHGFNDFVNYETSDLHLIAQFHPCEFEVENIKKLLWTDLSQWHNIIIIDWLPESLSSIIELAKYKRPDLQHGAQIRIRELDAFDRLKSEIPRAIRVQWEDMQTLDGYVDIINHLSEKLSLTDILPESVVKLYNSWSKKTQELLSRLGDHVSI